MVKLKLKLIGPHDYKEALKINMHETFDPEKLAEQLLNHPHYRFVKVEDKDLDLNDDGKFDEKDKSVAGKVLATKPKKKKSKK